MTDKSREKELLDQMASLAGRINRHKTKQKVKERRLLDDVARLAGKINRYKNEMQNSAEDDRRGLKRAREETGTFPWPFSVSTVVEDGEFIFYII